MKRYYAAGGIPVGNLLLRGKSPEPSNTPPTARRATRPWPISGAGTLLKLIARLKLHGTAGLHATGAVIVYKSVTENGPGPSAKDVLVNGPSARIVVKVSELKMSAAVWVYSPLAGSFSVDSTTVKPVDDAVPGLTLIELR